MVTGASEEKWVALIQWARARAHELLPADLMSVELGDALLRLCEETSLGGSTTEAANQLVFDFANADSTAQPSSDGTPTAFTLHRRKSAQPAA